MLPTTLEFVDEEEFDQLGPTARLVLGLLPEFLPGRLFNALRGTGISVSDRTVDLVIRNGSPLAFRCGACRLSAVVG